MSASPIWPAEMNLPQQYRAYQWNRPTLAFALFPFAFGGLVLLFTQLLDILHGRQIYGPEWLLTFAPLISAHCIFVSLTFLAFGNRFTTRVKRYVLLNLFCAPVSGLWFVCFYIFAWFTLSGR